MRQSRTFMIAAFIAGAIALWSAPSAFAGGNGGGGCGGGSCGSAPPPPTFTPPSIPPISIGIPPINIQIPPISIGGGGCGGGGCGGGGHHGGGGCEKGGCGGGGHGGARASASASASASAFVYNRVENNVYVKGGGSSVYYINRTPTPIGRLRVEGGESYSSYDSTLIVAVRAYCIASDGSEHPASRVNANTWLDAGFEGELYRCIEGTHLKAQMCRTVEAEEGMATVCDGEVIECKASEAIGHWKGGMVQCRPKRRVAECTERRLLRDHGPGDILLTIRREVRVREEHYSSYSESEFSLDGMYLDGGVGQVYGW